MRNKYRSTYYHIPEKDLNIVLDAARAILRCLNDLKPAKGNFEVKLIRHHIDTICRTLECEEEENNEDEI